MRTVLRQFPYGLRGYDQPCHHDPTRQSTYAQLASYPQPHTQLFPVETDASDREVEFASSRPPPEQWPAHFQHTGASRAI